MKNKKLHSLIYSLLYPAVLGTLIMFILLGASKGVLPWFRFRFFYACFLALYFSSQHIQNFEYTSEYKGLDFFFDILELFGMFFLFHFLGIMDQISEPNWLYFYIILAISFLIPVFGRLLKVNFNWSKLDENKKTLSLLSMTAAGFTVISIFCVDFREAALVFLYLVFFYYARYNVLN